MCSFLKGLACLYEYFSLLLWLSMTLSCRGLRGGVLRVHSELQLVLSLLFGVTLSFHIGVRLLLFGLLLHLGSLSSVLVVLPFYSSLLSGLILP